MVLSLKSKTAGSESGNHLFNCGSELLLRECLLSRYECKAKSECLNAALIRINATAGYVGNETVRSRLCGISDKLEGNLAYICYKGKVDVDRRDLRGLNVLITLYAY